ncbi:hypothetical protein KSP39_PZI014104 [Platanthera zijinensis]|uniref:Uncharacterized protein n=1 Tax=Platanthera zijinensis TaxID=2320716 RepID=A0AAP0BBE8_9ASPA
MAGLRAELEHHNICPFGVNALNGESIIRYPFSYERIEWKKSNETCDGYRITSFYFFNKKPLTFFFVRQIFFSSTQAWFCLKLHGRIRSGSPATTSRDPPKSGNLADARSFLSDSPATRSMKNLSKIRFLISDSPATTFKDPTLFPNLVAQLIGTPVGSSCIQIFGVPGPASTKNISSLKHKTEDCEASIKQRHASLKSEATKLSVGELVRSDFFRLSRLHKSSLWPCNTSERDSPNPIATRLSIFIFLSSMQEPISFLYFARFADPPPLAKDWSGLVFFLSVSDRIVLDRCEVNFEFRDFFQPDTLIRVNSFFGTLCAFFFFVVFPISNYLDGSPDQHFRKLGYLDSVPLESEMNICPLPNKGKGREGLSSVDTSCSCLVSFVL